MGTGENLTNAIRATIWHELGDKLNTAIPGIVNKYDPSGPTVEVAPAINKVFPDGQSLEYKEIVKVPVLFPRTKRFHFTYPLERGDTVLLVFSQRSMETWLDGDGSRRAPQDVGMFSTIDAVAIPGLFAMGDGSQGDEITDPESIELAIDNSKITVDGSGKIKMDTGGTVITAGTVTSGVVTGESLCAFTGLPHPDKSSKIFAEK